MRSDAILELFSEYSLAESESSENVVRRLAEHLSKRYNDMTAGELAFFLRVGGQLVQLDLEQQWKTGQGAALTSMPLHAEGDKGGIGGMQQLANDLAAHSSSLTGPGCGTWIVSQPSKRLAANDPVHNLQGEVVRSMALIQAARSLVARSKNLRSSLHGHRAIDSAH